MAEHLARYDAFGTKYAKMGYLVIGADHYAHGLSVKDVKDIGVITDYDFMDAIINSIKAVMPAMCPELEKAYKDLPTVHNGGEASNTFLAMQKMDKEELEKWREHLLRYCELDTFAMVKVLEKLREVGKC